MNENLNDTFLKNNIIIRVKEKWNKNNTFAT